MNVIAYHGTSSFLPFREFSPSMIGTGIVNNGGKKYKGFFFTSEIDNASFYTEWYVLRVKIRDVEKNPYDVKLPALVMKSGYEDKKIYLIENVLDGQVVSNITVVPMNRLESIEVLDWKFVGDEEFLFKKYDELFGEDEINQDIIVDTLDLLGLDLEFMLRFPEFKKYYEKNIY